MSDLPSDCQTLLAIASHFRDFSEKMSQDVCRMCLQRGAQSNFISMNFGQPSIKSKLSTFIPELNLEIIQDAVICGPCSAALENAYQLKVKCLRTEEKIWSHIHTTMALKPIATPVKLISLLPPSEYNTNHEEIMVEPNMHYYNQNFDDTRQQFPDPNPTATPVNKSYMNIDPGLPTKTNNNSAPVIGGKSAVHGDGFICTTCKQSFTSKEELHAHIPRHLSTRPYMCTYCYKCFTLKSNLQIHLRTHTQDRPFPCEYCHKCFTTKGNLKTHIRVHTKEKPYSCPTCDKSFIQKVQLNTHMLLHENDQIFACNVCEKSFSSKATLQVHKRIHDDIKPFICEYCDKSFTTNGNLVIHIRKHTGEKPYSCNVCGRSFSQAGQMKKHRKTHDGPSTEAATRTDIIADETSHLIVDH